MCTQLAPCCVSLWSGNGQFYSYPICLPFGIKSVKRPWRIWVIESHDPLGANDITSLMQMTIKPCACIMGCMVYKCTTSLYHKMYPNDADMAPLVLLLMYWIIYEGNAELMNGERAMLVNIWHDALLMHSCTKVSRQRTYCGLNSHINATTKWPTYCKSYFQLHFLGWLLIYSD